MKKHLLANKALSVLLAAVMCFSNVQPYATMAYGEEVLEQQSDAEPVPETAAPETAAPETSAPETPAPETAAPETAAPETAAPETAAPETAAPETAAPETAAPGTEAVTEAPATEQTPATEVQPATETVPQTEAQSESESESESETEILMPAVVLTQTMEDGTVITVDAPEDAFPEGVQMQVTVINPWDVLAALLREKGYSAGDAQQLASELIASKDVRVRDYVAAYDISFYLPKEGNKEIEPAKKVEVTFSNVNVEAKKASQIGTYHIEDNGEATKVNAHNPSINAAGNVEATVKTDSFSIYVVDGDVDAMLEVLEAADGTTNGREHTNLADFASVGAFDASYTDLDGNPITDPLGADEDFILTISTHEINQGMQYDMNTLTYKLPNGYKVKTPEGQDYISGTSTVTLLTSDGQTLELVSPFTVSKTTNLITYTWNQDDATTYARLAAAENVRLSISFQCAINENGTDFKFEDGDEVPVDLTCSATVIKTIQIDGDHVITAAEKEDMVFAIFDSTGARAKDKDGNEIPTWTYAEMAAQGNNQVKKTISGLVKGTYTVREIETLTIPDYTFSSTSATQDTKDIPASDERTFNLSNIYTQDRGKLILKKDFASGSALNKDNLTNDEAKRKQITFTVTGPNGFNQTYTYDDIFKAGEALTLNELPVGNYHVVETSNVTGYECTSTSYEVKVGGTSAGTGENNAPVDVEKDKDSEVTYTNNFRQKTGSLKLTKEFTGDAVTDALKNQITFTITGPNGYSRTVTYAEIASGSITITDLPIGTYTIKENRGSMPTGTQARTYINGSSSVSTTLQTTASVTDGGTATASYQNDYRQVGSLKINKKVTGDRTYAQIRDKSSHAYVIVTGPNGYNSGRINIQNSTFGANGTYTISNLPIGDYTVTEYNGSYSEYYTFTVTYDGSVSGTGTSTPGTSTVPQGGTGEVTVNNDYKRNKGKIHIEKTLSGDITSIADFKSKFTDPNTVLFTVSNGTYTYEVKVSDLDDNGKVSIEVPTSATAYKITEINADLKDFIRTTNVTLDGSVSTNPATVKVVQETPVKEHTAVFNNKYVNSGKLKITKSYVGALSAAEQSEVNKKLRFKILDADNNDAVVTVNGKNEFTLEEMLAGIDLPTGNYKVVESGDEYKPEIYTHGEDDVWSMLVTGDNEVDRTYGHTSAAKPVTPGNESYIYFYNQYMKVGVGVRVVKYVIIDGQGIDTDNPDTDENQFTAEQRRVENYVKDHIRFVVYAGTSATGTPLGTYAYREESITPAEQQQGVKPVSQLVLEPGTYTIVETNYDVDNYTASVLFYVSGSIKNSPVESKNHQVTFTVVAGGHIGIDITNGYTGYGKLVVKKAFGDNSQLDNENLTEAQKKAIQFTVTGYKNASFNDDGTAQTETGNKIVFGPETFSYFDMENGQKVFEKVPTGVYIVKETNGTGVSTLYNCTTTTEPDGNLLIELGNEKEITFTNTYTRKLGNLEVVKTFAGDPLNSDCDLSKIKFHVYDSNGNEIEASPKSYTELTNGRWTITGLPTGTYTVKEEGADYEENYYERTTTVSVNGGTATNYSDANGASGAVPENDTLSVELINSYKEVGALIFNKSFIDEDTINNLSNAQKAAVAFIVKDSTGATIKEIYYSDILDAIAAGESGYKLLVDAPADYTIIEDADIDGYERTTTVQVNAQDATYDETTGVSAHVERFTSSTVDFTNKYTEAGKLTVTKNIQYKGDLTEDQQKEFKFTVTDPDGNVLKDAEGNEIGIFTYFDMVKNSTGKVGTKTFENLPAGQYHIKEEIIHDGGTDDNPFYGLVRTTTITVGTDTTNGTEADFDVTKNNTNVVVTNKYDNVPPLTVVKRVGGYPTETAVIGGKGYPVWKFTLDVSNLSVATTENGMTEILDTYDVVKGADDPIRPEWFRTLTAAEAEQYVGDANANKLIPVDAGGNADGTTVTITENGTDGSTIKIEGVSENTTPHHTLTFYLVPKDENALGLLNLSDELDEAPEGSTEVIKSFNNNIKYKELPLKDWTTQKTPVEYNYRYEILSKKAKNYDAEHKRFYDLDHPEKTVYYAVYEIVLNEDAVWIGNKPEVDCEDEISDNQYVEEDSITFHKYVNGVAEEVDVAYTLTGTDHDSHVLKFKIDNGFRYTLTYKSDLLYTQEQLHTTVTIWNTIRMAGKEKPIVPVYTPESLGDASEDAIKLRKTDAANNSVTLAGAKFELYFDEDDARDPNVLPLDTYTTGPDGTLTITGYGKDPETGKPLGYVSANGKWWALKEIEAPPGFDLINYIVLVKLADRLNGETADFEQYIYLPTTAVGVKDQPFSLKVELGALKNVIGSDVAIAEGEYQFTLTGRDGAPTGTPEKLTDPAVTSPVTKSNDANGKASFGEILYRTSDLDPIKDASGTITGYSKTFEYEVKEVPGDKPGFSYDTKTHVVTVTVKLKEDGTALESEVKIDGKVATADNNVYFTTITNEYNAEGETQFYAHKHLDGRKIEAGEFEFNLKLDDTNTITVTNPAPAAGSNYDVDITFPKIKYVLDDLDGATSPVIAENQDGSYTVTIDPSNFNEKDGAGNRYVEYTYTVNETAKDAKGVTYTTDSFDINVVVTDNGDGTLKVQAFKGKTELKDKTFFTDNLVFKNKYKAKGKEKPEGTKSFKIDNEDLPMTEGMFTYSVVYDANTKGIVTNDSAGAIKYPTIHAVVDPAADLGDGNTETVVFDGTPYVTDITITVNNLEDFKDEYVFNITEVVPDPTDPNYDPNINYNEGSNTYEVKATITEVDDQDEDGDQVLKVTLNPQKKLDFINTSEGGEGEDTPEGNKYLNGDLSKTVYDFTITYDGKVLATVQNDDTGKINYPTFKFELDGTVDETTVTYVEADNAILVKSNKLSELKKTYTFTVAEKDAGQNDSDGVYHDVTTYTLTATADKTGTAGQLKVTLSNNAKELDFNNYGAKGKNKPSGKKTLEGKELKAGDFVFEISYLGEPYGQFSHEADGTINYPEIEFVLDASAPEDTITTATDPATGYVTKITIIKTKLDQMIGTGTKTYRFTVKEVVGQESGVIYDTSTLSFTAKVSKDASDQKTLKVELTDGVNRNFKNKVTSSGGSAQTFGTKKLTGRELQNNEFTFQLKDSAGNVLGTFKNNGSGVITYPIFTYVLDPRETAGRVTVPANGTNLTEVIVTVNDAADLEEVVYTVSEVQESEPGVTYSTATQNITVTPTFNASKNEIRVTAVAEEGKEFVNTYKAEGEAPISGEKSLTNRLPENDEFSFEIQDSTGETIATVKNSAKTINYPKFRFVVDPDATAAQTTDPVYDPDEGTITVTSKTVEDIVSKVYKFKVAEVKDTTKNYIVYDGTVYNLKITVTVDETDRSKLVVSIDQSEGLDFKNEYSAEGTMELEAQKTMVGRLLNTDDFEYELKDSTGKVLQRKKNTADGAIVFDTIKFTLANMNKDENGYVVDTVLTYTVNEVVPAGGKKDGVTYDNNTYKITVTLHDLKDGTINVKVEDEFDSLVEAIKAKYTFKNAFENTYEAVGEDTISGAKTLRGRNIAADEFSFEIKDSEGNVLATVKNNADGSIKYPKFRFAVAPNKDEGYSYDETSNTITYSVKNLEKMVTAEGTEIVDGVRHVTYSTKDYTFTVAEVTGDDEGVTYNDGENSSYTLTATVGVNAEDAGVLDVTIAPKTEIDFTNTYRAKGSSENEVGNKELWGRIIADKEFVFEVIDSNGEVLGTLVNDADGKITYPIFTYVVDPDLTAGRTVKTDEDGNLTEVIVTYNEVESLPSDKVSYTVTEKAGDKDGNKESGVTYNKNSFSDTIDVTVEVADEKLDDKYEKLNVEAKRATAADAAFKNYYKAKGEAPIEGTKWLTHRKPHDGEFTFQIKDSDGNVIKDASGAEMSFTNTGRTINYPTFEYVVDYEATAGTVYDAAANKITVTVQWVEKLENGFTYTIVEKDESADKPYITFTGAANPIELKVTVTPTGEKLDETYDKLKVEIEKDKENDFYNEYSATGSLDLKAAKILEGRIMNDAEFEFVLLDQDGKELQRKASTYDGVITFDTLEYDLDDMDHENEIADDDRTSYVKDTEYKYTVEEVIPEGGVRNGDGTYTYNGVTYDESKYEITVKLHDNEDGKIIVSVTPDYETFEAVQEAKYDCTEGFKEFENCYDAEGENTVSGTKTLRGRKIKEGEYKFTISDDEGEVIATVSNKADGTINYPTFKYVVDHAAAEDSVVFDEKSNTIIKTVDELEDMLTQVGKAGSDSKVSWDPKEYTYTVAEVIPDDAVDANGTRYADRKEDDKGPYTLSGVTYNTEANKYDLTVTVSLNEKDQGILDVAIEPNEKLDFVNLYKAKGEATVSGKKILECADIANYEGAFQFTITDSDGNVITTVKNDIQGVIQYPTFRYIVDPDLTAGAVYDADTNVYTVTVNAYEDLKAVYTYKVDEVQLEDETMAYNVYEDSYELKVTVKANEKDAAILDVTIPDNDDLSFTNRQYYFAGVAKIDAATKKDLKGAVLQLVASNGKVVEEWTTDGSTHLINLLSIEPGTYSFREKSAPKGYKLAETITFTVDKEGNVSSKTKFKVDKENNSIFTMKDERETPKIPKTGDTSNVFEWMLTMILALAAAIVLVIARRRRRAVR